MKKKLLLWLLILAIPFTFTACAAKGAAIVWEDPFIESGIRSWLNRPEGEIYPSNLKKIKELQIVGNTMYINNSQSTTSGEAKSPAQISSISTLADLKHFANLEILDIIYSEVKKIKTVSGIPKLKELHLSDITNLRSLAGISGLTKLKTFSLAHFKDIDLSPLTTLESLDKLMLSVNNLSNISPVGDIKTLTELNIFMCVLVEDYSAISKLSNLVDLSVSFSNCYDIIPFTKLENLQHLKLFKVHVTDLMPLAVLQNLKTITIDINDTYRLKQQAEALAKEIDGLEIIESGTKFIWPEIETSTSK